MKKNILLCIICSLSILPTIASCDSKPATSDTNTTVDYTAQLKFDENSGRKWEKTTLKQAIDGDTAHFNVSWADNGVYKARFLGIDTPESTGQIQAWGKAASKFTGEKLSTAYSIIIESNAAEWELDATGSRYTTWVWYQATADADYRLINLEIVQNGYSLLKNAGSTVYGEYFTVSEVDCSTFTLEELETAADFANKFETDIKELKTQSAPSKYKKLENFTAFSSWSEEKQVAVIKLFNLIQILDNPTQIISSQEMIDKVDFLISSLKNCLKYVERLYQFNSETGKPEYTLSPAIEAIKQYFLLLKYDFKELNGITVEAFDVGKLIDGIMAKVQDALALEDKVK